MPTSSVVDMSSAVQGAPSRWESQRSFDELGRPLRDITFCVVDLETTGGSAAGRLDDHRDRRGQGARRRGARRVPDPGQPAHRRSRRSSPCSPASPTRWSPTPRRSSRRCRRSSSSPPAACWSPTTRRSTSASSSTSPSSRAGRGRAFEVLDTAKLARRVITRDDAPNCKLSSLARAVPLRHRRPTTGPSSDARATVDVLHGLMERLGGLGVHTLEELQTFSSRVTTAQRRKRHLAEGLPHAPGVYLFRDDRAAGPLRRHLPRPAHPGPLLLHRLRDPLPDGRDGRPRRRTVDGIECATPLEAEVRELRLIAEHKPRYNRRSRFPEKVHFVKLTREPWPRLSLVRRVLDDDADYLGPFSSPQDRREVPGRAPRHLPGPPVLRPARPRRRRASPCVLAEMGRCLSPCDGSADADDVRRRGAAAARHPAAPPRRRGRGDQPRGWPASPPTSGSRRPASTATGWPRSSGPPPAPSGSPRSPAAPRSSPPAARTTAAGRSTSSATAGWPPPA